MSRPEPCYRARMIKKLLLGLVAILVLVAGGGGAFAYSKISAFDEEMAKKWDVPLADVKAPDLSAAAAAVANPPPEPAPDDVEGQAKKAELAKQIAIYKRGEHLTKSIGACLGCHGDDLATPEVIKMGPVATVAAPNISMAGKLKEYSDAELHRLLVHGIKRDGTSVLFMNAADWRWWPDEDVMALVGYLRTRPAVDKPSQQSTVGALGKILDQTDKLPLSVARRAQATPRVVAAEPKPDADYGKNLGALCMGCHGPTLSGGPIPGAPPDMPVPANITLHETGIKHYDFAKFEKLMREAKKPDGSDLNPFMPVRDLKHMDDVEMKALWAFLQSVPPKPFGGR